MVDAGRCPVLLSLPETSISTTPPTKHVPASYMAVPQKGEMYSFALMMQSCSTKFSWQRELKTMQKYKNKIGLLELFYIK